MRFEVTHHLPGHDAPVVTLTDAAGVAALLAEAESNGSVVRVRPYAPGAGGAADAPPEGDASA
ncbi:hypothetical protein ACEZCY_20235 [Streptacidiphilus sp. N1-12]|uniref:Uncharacterized protein n=2 Tax=Streptacidiphilus alkalitolerans TaxID=3342712 RepID=A0ABV6VD07_9ACTN